MTTANFETEKVDEKEYGVVASVAELEQQAPTQQQETIRALKGRQMSMIAIGGAIGMSKSTLSQELTLMCRYRIDHWVRHQSRPLRSRQSLYRLHHHGHSVSYALLNFDLY